ncbi:hypothetical protein [Bradyrhizobium elkanii]|uniref:hypothetical protein n=1 Tax=Bradyrhizobium elkanii TaxID=29448 RepID=UPI001873008D|nr:hypothetical protein [Bradyrhizobium elkanii]WLA84833.1 hypothetical protein QNJ99_11615 [Bradyrhizobium elkanii]
MSAKTPELAASNPSAYLNTGSRRPWSTPGAFWRFRSRKWIGVWSPYLLREELQAVLVFLARTAGTDAPLLESQGRSPARRSRAVAASEVLVNTSGEPLSR